MTGRMVNLLRDARVSYADALRREHEAAMERLRRTGSIDPPGYADMVRRLEDEGLTTSDAQGVADAHFMVRP
jgi:hypothetical protein